MASTVGMGRVGSGAKLARGSHFVGTVVVAGDGAAVVVVGSVSAPSERETAPFDGDEHAARPTSTTVAVATAVHRRAFMTPPSRSRAAW
jgi:hypothetical protein